MIEIPIIDPEEMSYEETSRTLEQINKEEKRRKKAEKEYIFNEADMKELNRRLVSGEDLDEVVTDISMKGITSLLTLIPATIPTKTPIPSIPKLPTIQRAQPTEPTEPTEPTPIYPTIPEHIIEPIPEYLIERARKKAKMEEKKKIRSEEQRIDYPAEECCSNVCNTINKEIEQHLGDTSGDKDIKLKFDTLRELRRQFYIQDACQCANGHTAQQSGIPLREKQIEDCCPKVCHILNNAIEGYEGILFPTHNVRIKSETVYDIRAKMYNNDACKCVETAEQLKKPTHGGSAMDPVLQNKLIQLAKYAEKQGWIK